METVEEVKIRFENNEILTITKSPNFVIARKNGEQEQWSLYYNNYVLVVFLENGKPKSYHIMPVK